MKAMRNAADNSGDWRWQERDLSSIQTAFYGFHNMMAQYSDWSAQATLVVGDSDDCEKHDWEANI